MGDDLVVGSEPNLAPFFLQLLAQLAIVLDDAVVHDREPIVAWGCALLSLGLPWGSPSGYGRCRSCRSAAAREPRFEIAQLAFRRAVLRAGPSNVATPAES